MLQLLIDLRDGLQFVKGQVQLHQGCRIEHSSGNSRVHKLVVREPQVLKPGQFAQVSCRHTRNVIVVSVEDFQCAGDSSRQLLQLVVAHIQR